MHVKCKGPFVSLSVQFGIYYTGPVRIKSSVTVYACIILYHNSHTTLSVEFKQLDTSELIMTVFTFLASYDNSGGFVLGRILSKYS